MYHRKNSHQSSAMLWLLLWFVTTFLCKAAAEASNGRVRLEDGGDDELVKVIIGFKTSQDKTNFEKKMIPQQQAYLRSSDTTTIPKKVVSFKKTNSVAMTLTQSELRELQDSGEYDYIEPDREVRLYHQSRSTTEEVPYGILTVLQAQTLDDVYTEIPPPPPLDDSSTEEDCFRVCIIDTGLFVGHPDIPFNKTTADAGDNNVRLNGAQFGLPPGQFWYNPVLSVDNSHGTHVAGTIFAAGSNQEGVVGVIPNPQGMCLSIVRVFGDDEGTTSLSAINQGVEWCANQNSRVINMSLGFSGAPDASGKELYSRLWQEGILVVAAAGNDGDTSKSYPASHNHVLSVAAVDEDNAHADFSQRNNAVDIAAPGVDVLSTTNGGLTMHDTGDTTKKTIPSEYMQFSPQVELEDTSIIRDGLEVVDCQSGFTDCKGAVNRACLIERGTTTFLEKAINCQDGGGVLALIYNNQAGEFFGSLGPDHNNRVSIPVLALGRETGLDVLNGSGALNVRYDEFGYSLLSGTSMASPHVAGVAAKIWAARPACTNAQVQEALLSTALDLGLEGRDNRYGHGLVQGLDAYNYLLALEEPCGLVPLPSDAPSRAPSPVPSNIPTSIPTAPPSGYPTSVSSEVPSQLPTVTPIPTTSPSLETEAAALLSSGASSPISVSGSKLPFFVVLGMLVVVFE